MTDRPDRRPGARLVWKISLAAAAIVVVVLTLVLVALGTAAARAADAAAERALAGSTRLVRALLDGRERGLTSGVLVFAQNPIFRSLVIERRPDDLLDQAQEAAERTGASWVQIVDAQGVRLAKSDEPAAPADTLARSALIAGALDGAAVSGIGVTGDTLLFQAVAVPVGGTTQLAGALMAALPIDSVLADSVTRATRSEIVFFALDRSGAPRVTASTLGRGEELGAFVRRWTDDVSGAGDGGGEPARAELELAGAHYLGRGELLRSAGGEVLGGFVALRSREAELAPFAPLRRGIAIAGVLGLLLALALSYAMARGIARPVLALADAARRAAEGDYGADVTVRGGDEIGALAEAMRTMLHDLREKQALVEVLAADRADESRAPGPVPIVALDTDAGALAPGRRVAGRYEIGETLGTGGAGIVYRAFDHELGEVVALKTLRRDALLEDPAALERLKSEIRLARRISHRNVVRTHDLGEAEGLYFVTMEYVSGTSLRALLDHEGRLPVAAALAIGKQLCRALEVAHEQGIIHRDIKPQNLMVQPDGVLKVMDFGIARLARRTEGLTRTGMVVGTPAYMAPEQLLDDEVDARADLYAAGVVLYECLTGRRPFGTDSPMLLIGRMLADTPPSPASLVPEVPAALSDVVMRTIAGHRDTRPASAAELHDLLVGTEG